MSKLIILWHDYSGENHTPLMINGMAAIPKIRLNGKIDQLFKVCKIKGGGLYCCSMYC